MERPLVVGVDGSEHSLRAVDWAAQEAARHGLPLRLVEASLWARYEKTLLSFGSSPELDRQRADDIVVKAAERASKAAPGVQVTTDVLPDDTVTALVRESEAAFALVLGHRGRGGFPELMVGSVALQVAGRAHGPVFVLRETGPNTPVSSDPVVLGVGDGGSDSAAVEFALREAALRGAALHAVHAWRRIGPGLASLQHGTAADAHGAQNTLTAALGHAVTAHPDIALHQEVREGPARDVLMSAASSASLLVVGARHRTHSPGLQLGPVTHALLHHVSCPLAIVPQPQP
ncbi:universal stress protein [Streptomyces atratus]|uniref:universal stress protein n=1 Tax=Streptomyces atratus TaxID=1893 RepID=UPI0022532F66|nr:universal stress protein [Streptomyces atratus]MCX5338514.1 universal stress protein [Streptomyces atratus]